MATVSSITEFKKGIFDLNITSETADAGFSVYIGGGNASEDPTDISDTAFAFSGSGGFIFDNDGYFVGGYSKGKSFNIQVHAKGDETYSYFIDEVLIANNKSYGFTGDSLTNAVKVEKNGSLSIGLGLSYKPHSVYWDEDDLWYEDEIWPT